MTTVVDLDGGWADVRNPRVDLLTYRNTPMQTIRVVYGTPTPGADLYNLCGSPRLPDGETLITHVLISAGSGHHLHKLSVVPTLVYSTAAAWFARAPREPLSIEGEHQP
jgi:hypothetical protein